jgi:hypothetical protein
MALPLVIPSTVQIRLLWILNAQLGVNVLHGIAAGGTVVNQALANTLGTSIKSAFTTNLAPHMNSNTALTKVGVRDIRAANLPEFLDVATGVGGVAVGDALPSNVALCLTLRTASSGKSFRGRAYIGGWAETVNINNGVADTIASTSAVAFMTAVSNAFTASGLTLAVASRPAERYTIVKTVFHNDGTTTGETIGQGNARAGSATPVTVIESRSAGWESQRRRTNGRGVPISLFGAVASSTIH